MIKTILLLLLITPLFINGQKSSWTNQHYKEQAFIKNEGQFKDKNWQSDKIEYVAKEGIWYTFFTNKGLTYRLDKLIRNPNKKEGNHNHPSRVYITELVHVAWIGANNNVQIVAENKVDHYNSYAIQDPITKEVTNINHIEGYKKITYKNLYNNIDVEYIFPKDGGIKYSVILHPGADPSQIKMQYKTDHTNIKEEYSNIQLNQAGELEINTSIANLIEHKPVTFYNDTKLNINSKYIFSNNILSFHLDSYDVTKKVIIDPWVVAPAWVGPDFTREVETDGTGNVYVIGGETPMQLRKYDITGNLIWTYNAPWSAGAIWLGTLATDDLGTSYITAGLNAEIEKINNAGGLVWHQNGPTSPFVTEYWAITFNCDNTKLIIGGTGPNGGNTGGSIYTLDANNGNVIDSVIVGIPIGIPSPLEVRAIAPTKNSKYVYLTHNEVGVVNEDFITCSSTGTVSGSVLEVNNTTPFSYASQNYLSTTQGGAGIKAIIANDNFFYTHTGDRILQWDINTGALINSVALPSGSSIIAAGLYTVQCNGLDIDVAGNVYAGSMDRVVQFDPNLNVISTALTAGGFTVYDVSVNSNGEVIAGGAIFDQSVGAGRAGRIEALNMSAGAQYITAICCDPAFCNFRSLCITDAPVNLNPNTPGGTWGSSPFTLGLNTITGVFDPAVAGAGTYTVTYSLACGSDSSTIVVEPSCIAVCIDPNGDLTASGGTAPYIWDELITIVVDPQSSSAECIFCG
ncbi:MAG: hypothetical protein HRT73_10110, partial [Flavobacteriales bacterium]|nr:hypothetical protein [Flavobacteriales bacterium]